MSMSAVGWVFFGFAVWAAVIVLKALQNRLAPELNEQCGMDEVDDSPVQRRSASVDSGSNRENELRELRKRVEVLEAIVTDRKYQWEADLNRSPGENRVAS